MKSAIMRIYDNFGRRINEYSLENANGTRILANSSTAALEEYSFLKHADRCYLLAPLAVHSGEEGQEQTLFHVIAHENSLTFRDEKSNAQATYTLFEDDSLSARYNFGHSTENRLDLTSGLLSNMQVAAEAYREVDWHHFFAKRGSETNLLVKLASRSNTEDPAMILAEADNSLHWEIYSNAQWLLFQTKLIGSRLFLIFSFMSEPGPYHSLKISHEDIWVNNKIVT